MSRSIFSIKDRSRVLHPFHREQKQFEKELKKKEENCKDRFLFVTSEYCPEGISHFPNMPVSRCPRCGCMVAGECLFCALKYDDVPMNEPPVSKDGWTITEPESVKKGGVKIELQIEGEYLARYKEVRANREKYLKVNEMRAYDVDEDEKGSEFDYGYYKDEIYNGVGT